MEFLFKVGAEAGQRDELSVKNGSCVFPIQSRRIDEGKGKD